MNTDPLQQLRDIHLPEAISMWPQTLAWYFLFLLVGVLLIFSFVFLMKKYIRLKKLKEMQNKLDRIFELYPINPQHCFMELSQFMRRLVLLKYPREKVAGLQGQAWLIFLDSVMETDLFSKGPGRVLIVAPYTKEADVDRESLSSLVKQFIQSVM